MKVVFSTRCFFKFQTHKSFCGYYYIFFFWKNITTYCQHKKTKTQKRESGSSSVKYNHKGTKYLSCLNMRFSACENASIHFWFPQKIVLFFSFFSVKFTFEITKKKTSNSKSPCRLKKAVCYRFSYVLFNCIFVFYFNSLLWFIIG